MNQAARLAILLHAVAAAGSIAAFTAFRPAAPARLAARRGALALAGRWAYWATRPLVDAAAAARIPASGMTAAGVVISLVAAGAAAVGAWGWAGVLLLWGSACDLLDGELARGTGTASPAGAFLDSSLDRVSEIALFAGLALSLPGRDGELWAGAALVASLMVSYARARGEGLGVECPPFGMERPHRLLSILAALLAAPFLGWRTGAAVVQVACAVVAIGAGATALGRMIVIHQMLRRASDGRGAPGPGTPPR